MTQPLHLSTFYIQAPTCAQRAFEIAYRGWDVVKTECFGTGWVIQLIRGSEVWTAEMRLEATGEHHLWTPAGWLEIWYTGTDLEEVRNFISLNEAIAEQERKLEFVRMMKREASLHSKDFDPEEREDEERQAMKLAHIVGYNADLKETVNM